MLLLADVAQATVSTWTASGSLSGLPVEASATITTGTNSLIVSLSNLEASLEISDIEIILSNTSSSVSLTGSTGTLIDVNPGGTFDVDSGPITHWAATLDMGQVLSAAAGNGAPPGHPFDLIIGPPGTSGTYSNANSSITTHIQNTATFDLVANGLGPTTTVTAVNFSFVSDAPPGVRRIPEPMSIGLLGTGLIGLAFVRRKYT